MLANTDRLTNNNAISGAGSLGHQLHVADQQRHDSEHIEPTARSRSRPPAISLTTACFQANGGPLQLSAGTFLNGGATIQAINASQVQLSGGNVSGGTLTTSGGGLILNIGNSTIGNLTNNGAFAANNGTTTNLIGTITNTGNIAINSAGNNTDVIIQGDVTLAGNGTVVLSNTTANRIYGATNTDRLTNSNTISGAGSIGINFLALTNNGTILANLSQPINIDVVAGAGNLLNAGTVQSNVGSAINIGSGDILRQTAGLTLANGALNFAGGGLRRYSGRHVGGAPVPIGGNVANGGGTVSPGADAFGRFARQYCPSAAPTRKTRRARY